jgi:hypothetical protein
METKMFKKALAVAGATIALTLIAGPAFADDCVNLSRPAPDCNLSCTEPVIEGNWVWLPSIGIDEAAWGFGTPGSIVSQQANLPGSSGNYLNDRGGVSWLLENSAVCTVGVPSRQTTHGIQTGCGE